MEYFIDTADVALVEKASHYFPLSGVTTNPGLLARAGKPLSQVVNELRTILPEGKLIHAQVLAASADLMVEEAKFIHDLDPRVMVVKIPITPDGLRAVRTLKSMAIPVTVTAVFTVNQGLLAAASQADFVAPYVSRIGKGITDGFQVVSELVQAIRLSHAGTRVIAASLKTPDHVHMAAAAGCDAVTLPYDVLSALCISPQTEESIKGFERDWVAVFGKQSVF